MGAGQSDLYRGTYGDNPDNVPDALKGRISLPKENSQLKHIFRKEAGHVEDTPENRKMLQELANDPGHHIGKDMWGNEWHVRNNENGTQDWVRHRNMIINEGGRNMTQKKWSERTGLNYDPWDE